MFLPNYVCFVWFCVDDVCQFIMVHKLADIIIGWL